VSFGFCVQPLAEMTQQEYQYEIADVPLIDNGEEGPFRCHRCKAYVNPFMQFIEGGTKATCNLCLYTNDVPVNYQSQLNEFGQRRDKQQRPELLYGTYEFATP
jgi:protein transport protein SEC24